VKVTVEGIPKEAAQDAARAFARLERYTSAPVDHTRLTLRRGPGRSKRPYVADAHVAVNGSRVLAAHVSGETPERAAEAAAERIIRQLQRLKDETEPPVIFLPELRPERNLKPPEEREIVARRTYPPTPFTTVEAVTELLDADFEFFIFVHATTAEDVVVHRRDDGQVGLLHPRGSPLAHEREEGVVPEPSRYPGPITLVQARDEMDVLNHRFLYFIDAGDERGRVLYLRHDGDYGLVEPAGSLPAGDVEPR
jgi:ribosome-associated translation inhibitor RaiA